MYYFNLIWQNRFTCKNFDARNLTAGANDCLRRTNACRGFKLKFFFDNSIFK